MTNKKTIGQLQFEISNMRQVLINSKDWLKDNQEIESNPKYWELILELAILQYNTNTKEKAQKNYPKYLKINNYDNLPIT